MLRHLVSLRGITRALLRWRALILREMLSVLWVVPSLALVLRIVRRCSYRLV